MGVIGGELGYRILKAVAPSGKGMHKMDGSAFANRSKMAVLLGDETIASLRGRTVVDFGCGEGADAA